MASSLRTSAVVLVALFAIYALPFEFVPGNDCKATVFQPVVLLHDHQLTFTPANAPFMFDWAAREAGRRVHLRPHGWTLRSSDARFQALAAAGQVEVTGQRYFLSPTRFAGHYLNNYGSVPGVLLTAALLPARALLGDLRSHPAALWHGAQLTAAWLTALAAALLWAAARARSASAGAAWLVALSFGLGTVAWPMASQSPYQQSFALPLLALALWAAPGSSERARRALVCGLALGLATAIRPTLGWYGLCFGAWLAWRSFVRARGQRSLRVAQPLVAYSVAAALPVLSYLLYNLHYFGSVAGVGQVQRTAEALHQDPWGTPLHQGLAGVLLSPSHGLFVYSPVLLGSFYGVAQVLRRAREDALLGFTAGALLIVLTCAKWAMWWGGWCYGPRLLLDVLPVLCLLLAPLWQHALRSRVVLVLLGVTFAWSVFTSALGASAYDLVGWDLREVHAVVDARTQHATLYLDRERARQRAARDGLVLQTLRADTGDPLYQHRLWSVKDSPIWYYLTHWSEARQQRLAVMQAAIDDPAR